MNWLFAQPVTDPPLPPVPVPSYPGYPGGSGGWVASLVHELMSLGPVGFFAIVFFVALAYTWWMKNHDYQTMRDRFMVVVEIQACFATIIGKMCKGKKPPIDVDEDLGDIKELIDMARRPTTREPTAPWWRRRR